MNYARLEGEIARGRLWRAKEILRGRLSHAKYDCELFARYAAIFEAMHDDDEAGRFYFLSGENAIAARTLAQKFLERRQQQSLNDLWAAMPIAAHRVSPGAMREETKNLLAGFGHTPESIAVFCNGLASKADERAQRQRHVRSASGGLTGFAPVEDRPRHLRLFQQSDQGTSLPRAMKCV